MVLTVQVGRQRGRQYADGGRDATVGVQITRRGVLLGGLAVAGGAVCTGVLGAGQAWALDTPSIIGCDDWDARSPRLPIAVHNRRPAKILVHHTASANVRDHSREAAERLARSIQNHHLDARRWADSGQHFTISRGGYVLEGRHRSLEMLRGGRRMVEGAHCTGQNIIAVGIENEGTYTATGPTDRQWDRLRRMCAYVCQQYRVRPTEIYGHRDFRDTACPGDVLYAMLPKLRTEVAALLREDTGDTAGTEAWPLLRVADRGADVQAAQHLLRAAGHTEVVPDGRFDRRTADAVRRFQKANGTEEVNGMIGGESWPLLVAPATTAVSGRETVRALLVLGSLDPSGLDPSVLGPSRVDPSGVDTTGWQRLLRREAVRRGR
jgi:N-acetylmuramoyl-L-alanine amidase/Putative peptidoglycan binding domain